MEDKKQELAELINEALAQLDGSDTSQSSLCLAIDYLKQAEELAGEIEDMDDEDEEDEEGEE